MPEVEQRHEKKSIPIVPYLRLPDGAGGEAYLIGSRCRKCGETYLGGRAICIRCYGNSLEDIKLGKKGEIFTYTIIHQSAPWVKTPYVAAVVKLAEGPVLRTSLVGVDAKPGAVKVGTPVEMVIEKVREDREGNDVIAYKFRPVS